MIGRTGADFVSPERAAKYRLADREVLESGVSTEIEEYRDSESGPYYVRSVRVPVRDDDGTVTGVLTIDWDTTQRHLVEEKLEAERNHLRALIDNLPDSVYFKDAELRFIAANASHLGLLGLSSEAEILGKTDFDVHLKEAAERYRKAEEQLLQTGMPDLDREEELEANDGRRFWISTSQVPLKDSSGRVIGLVGIGRDITERKHHERELRDLARFPAENPEPVLRATKTGKLIYANPASSTLLEEWGCRPGEELPDRLKAVIGEAAADKSVRSVEEVADKRTYKLAFVRVAGEEYLDIYGRDVTDERILEQQLLQAQKMQAIGRLAGGVAHDFNNMLTVVLGFSDALLARSDLSQGAKVFIEKIKEAGGKAASLADQLLAFSRNRPTSPRLLDLNESLAKIGEIVGRVIGGKIDLKTAPSPEPAMVVADSTQIDQVLMNLVINAKDAMPEGGEVTLETKLMEVTEDYAAQRVALEEGPYVMLSVSDTGTGMDKETQERIFEPFFTTKEEGRGTGLGLATVYGIVLQSKGGISVYSELGRGTTFKIYLPRAALESTPDPHPPEAGGDEYRGTETVLIVEDAADVRDLAVRSLRELGYSPVAVGSAEEALSFCQKHRGEIHLILTDVVLGEMSGQALSEQIVQIDAAIKIVFMSGFTGKGVVSQGVHSGKRDFLQKPFSREDLARAIRSVLDRNAEY